MGREFPVMEDELELSLELSIGGCYANSGNKNLEREKETPHEGNEDAHNDIPRSDFYGGENKNDMCELSDLQRKREIQALKRREARMKREVKKSRGLNGGSFFRARVEERDEIPSAKREKTEAENLSNVSSLFGENKVCGTQEEMQAQLLLPVGNGFACPWAVPFWGSNYFVGGDADGKSSGDEPENVEAPPCSSVVSHHRSTCTSHKGGSSSDSGSHSSSFGTHEKQQGEKVEHDSDTTKTTDNAMQKPSTSPTPSTAAAPPQQMPCVSATGNGPNAKTITGFLYKYTKSQVTIMCVCHGTFFSPAQFVEHAGGVHITNPLRHITVLPSLIKS